MRLLLAALLLLPVLLGPAAAQQAAPRSLAAGEMLRGSFLQERRLQGFANPLRSEGRYLVLPGRGLLWHIETPFPSDLVITPGGILQLVDGKETMRVPATRAPFLARLYAVLGSALLGDFTGLEQEFRIDRRSAGQGWEIRLTPKRADDPVLGQIKQITLAGEMLVDRVRVERAEGDSDEMRFERQSLGPVSLTEQEAQLFRAAQP